MNFRILYNPFEKYSEKTLFVAGFWLLFLFSILAHYLKIRFDGIMDMHIVGNVLWHEPLIDNLLNAFTLFVLFFVFGKMINSKTRAIDILNTSLISRIPIYLISLTNIGGVAGRATQNILDKIDFNNLQNVPQFEISDLAVIVIFSLFSLALLVWMIALFWNGFRVATNTKGVRNVVVFVVLFVLAEVVSKVLISIFNI